MPKLVPQASIVVIRDGKRVSPAIGKAFDFTDQEVQAIREASAAALRRPVNESASADDTDGSGDDTATAKSGEVDAAETGDKPTATEVPKRSAKSRTAERSSNDAAKKVNEGNADEDEDI